MMHAFALRCAIECLTRPAWEGLAMLADWNKSVTEKQALSVKDVKAHFGNDIPVLDAWIMATSFNTLRMGPADAEDFCRIFVRIWCEGLASV